MLLLSEERECGKMKKKKIMFIILCMLTVLAAGTAHATEKERVDPLQPAIAEKILRFHVLANSDAKDDQNVKLKVRDAVGHMLGQKLKKVTDRAQTEKIVQDHMDEIIETAEKTLHKNGYTYGASARLANVDFPVKTYGDYTFPAGKYRALQITLGKGEGHNWWCVMFPPMCLPAAEDPKQIEDVLNPGETDIVEGGEQYEVKFKIVEWFEEIQDCIQNWMQPSDQ